MIAPSLVATPNAEVALNQALRTTVWRASELAISGATTVSTGHNLLDVELPNKGGPRSFVVEMLVEQHGIGEMQLLKPCWRSSQKISAWRLSNHLTCRIL